MRKIGKRTFKTGRVGFPCVLLLLTVLSIVPAAAQQKGDIEVKASIGADKIGMDDVLLYTVTFKGINNPGKPDLNNLEAFKVAQSSRSTEFRFINGIASYYTNFVYYLTPLKTGTFTLPPVTYQYQGREFKTRAFTVQIVMGSVAPHQQQQKQPPQRRRFPSIFDDDDVFSSPFKRSQPEEIDIRVLAVPSKRKVFYGEQITLRLMLYTRNRIRQVNMLSNQSIPGFWQEWFPLSRSIDGETKTIRGKVYQVYEVRKVALFPSKAGTLTIPSLKFELGLAADSFSIFSNNRRVVRDTAATTIEVEELPREAVGLSVGRFRLDVRSTKKEVDINDILTLKIKLSGSGNIKTLTPPEFKDSDYFKVYPAKISRDVSLRDGGVSGFVEAEVPVAFKKTGLISFPALQFKYYDPGRAGVVSLESPVVAVTVTGKKETQGSVSSVPRTEIIKRGEDIDFIKKGTVYSQDKNLYQGGFFTLLLLLPFIVNLLFILKVYAFDRYIVNSELLTGRKKLNRAVKSLHNVRDPGDISPILETYLKEKAGLRLSAITNQSIDRMLGEYGVSDSDIKTFIRLKTESESSRFSGVKASAMGSASSRQLKQDTKSLIEILKRIDSRIK